MIEFGTKRSGGGKKSRFHKKFSRKKIDRVGEKVAGWFRSNWDDDSYPYFSGNLHKLSWTVQNKLYPRVTYGITDSFDIIRDKSDIIFITKINPDKQM